MVPKVMFFLSFGTVSRVLFLKVVIVADMNQAL